MAVFNAAHTISHWSLISYYCLYQGLTLRVQHFLRAGDL